VRGRPTPAAAISTGPGGGGVPAAGSRAAALALANRLLSRLALPAGTRPVRLRVLPALLRQPELIDGGADTAEVHRVYLLPQPMTAVPGFLTAHAPAGMRRFGSGQAAGAGGVTMESVSYEPRSLPPGIHSAELAVAVVPAPGGGSVVRADAEAVWYPARSAAEHIDPVRYREAVVSIHLFSPRPRTVTRTIVSARVIARLAGLVNGLRAAPNLAVNCPAILASYRITFVPAAAPVPRAVVAPSGCLTVGVTVAGKAQPPLWGDTGLIGAAKRLLPLKPAP
jgi:hypothetical protein